MSPASSWGVTEEERRIAFPCDGLVVPFDAELYRGVTIASSAPVIFRWLCQLRVAPYSYDWIDNRGRQSPRTLTPGLEELALGQQVMEIFTLAGYDRDRHLTLRVRPRSTALALFGDIAGTYLVVPGGASCRLLVKLVVRYPRGIRGRLTAAVLPLGDLVMMRRQLLNLKALAEGA